MARQEVDREDILREATALVKRAEFEVPGLEGSVVIGFRKDGSGSIYIGADLVYQLNSVLQFRRGYLNGDLVKADQGRLVSLRRHRKEDAVSLVRHEFDQEQSTDYLNTLRGHIDQLQHAFQVRTVEVIGQVPASEDVVGTIERWLDSIPSEIEIARAPNAR